MLDWRGITFCFAPVSPQFLGKNAVKEFCHSVASVWVFIGMAVMPTGLAAAPIAYVYSTLGQFGTVNLVDGSFQSLSSPDILVNDLNTAAGQPLYVIDAGITSNLRSLDPLTGQTTPIGNTDESLQGIEVNQNGILFGQSGSTLYALSPSTGTARPVGDFGEGLHFDFAEGAFSAAGTLYMVGHSSGASGTSLYGVNPQNGTATLIGLDNSLVEAILFANETLYGFTGTNGSPDPGPIVTINLQTGLATILVNQDPNLAVVVGAGTQVAAVPEPGTWAGALATTGIWAVAAFRRRKHF